MLPAGNYFASSYWGTSYFGRLGQILITVAATIARIAIVPFERRSTTVPAPK